MTTVRSRAGTRAQRGLALTLLLAFLALAVPVGCAPRRPAAQPADGDGDGIDVVLFVVDTLRADRVGAYGYAGARTPNLDALADSGVLFEQAYAPGPWTLPTVASLHTSTFMCEHGVVVNGQQVPGSIETLAERLNDEGYATASFFANPFAGPMTGLDRGFDVVERTQGADATTITSWLDGLDGRRQFLYVHNVEPHNPHDVPQRYLEPFAITISDIEREAVRSAFASYRHLARIDFVNGRVPGTTDTTTLQRASLAFLDELRAPVSVMYDAQVTHADARIGSVVEELRRRGRWDRTLFIVVADHGEEFGEHGGWLHDQSVYEELVRVPMIVRFPGDAHAASRVSDVVSLVDVLPTILAALDLDEQNALTRGHDLLPSILDAATERTADERIETRVPSMRTNRKKYFKPWKESRGDRNVVVRQDRWKGIWNAEYDRLELYDLESDPRELEDLSAREPERALMLRDHAAGWLAECLASSPTGGETPFSAPRLDAETEARLRSLGYI